MIEELRLIGRGSRAWWIAAALAAIFLFGHLPFLASSIEDVDSANFVLGLRDFDPGRHRPHPPGYPIYMVMAKAAATVTTEPHALAIWGALFGSLAAFALMRLFACLDALDPEGEARAGTSKGLWESWLSPPVVATLITMTAPLMWMTASRPMSDTFGFAVAIAAQALIATALVQQSRMRDRETGRLDPALAAQSGRLLLIGAFACAVSIGVRSQATWLTVPLLIGAVVARRRREAVAAFIGSVVWFAAGILLWLVPLVLASGGPAKYLAAFASQAGEDWTGVDLLATHPTPRKLAFALNDTFVLHWAGLGWLMLAAAAVGFGVMLVRRRRGLGLLLLAFVPYGLFHLGFQETFTTRYALPLVPPVAYLAVKGLFLLGRVTGRGAALALSCGSLVLTVPVAATYARTGSPTTRALADLAQESTTASGVILGSHHAFSRIVEASATAGVNWRTLPAPPKHEWLSLVNTWTAGSSGPIWFLADPRRTDLALIDSRAMTVKGDYSWSFSTQVFLGGIRPDRLQWIAIDQPGWFAGEGWDLTPETAGVARVDRRSLADGPLVAWIKRRDSTTTMMIGGRHLGMGSGPTARVDVTVDGRQIDSWTIAPANQFFLRFVTLPAAALAGEQRYGRLEVQAHALDNASRTGIVAIDQFDLQDPTVVLKGYDSGWNEPEYNPTTGLTWRWTTPRALLRTTSVDRDLELRVTGESPMKYFSRPSRVTVSAGERSLFSQDVAADFAWSIRVPAAAVRESGGLIAIASDQSFRPVDRGENADTRSLALRIYSVALTPASEPGTVASSRTASASIAASRPRR